MARIFVTGSADGLGLGAGRALLDDGHEVVLHARTERRAADIRRAEPRVRHIVVGDLSSIAETRRVAGQANDTGRFHAVIHNAGIGYTLQRRAETADGLERHFAVNVLAPYLLTALISRPGRLIYLSSGMHTGGAPNLDDPQWTRRRWSGSGAYSDSKLLDVVLTLAVARRWPDVLANAVDPGWVATRMGGRGAPESLASGVRTQVWLATSDDPAATVTGRYFYHQQAREPLAATRRVEFQDRLLDYCAALTGTPLP
ncbi:MAG TPA: SDR family NAD(P)-dependent oxidoreductase [Actinoplanes sp.]|nr:SDR family NAD(P)-dependent oxidoreductase [Actinoplanes sp.]